MAGKSKSYGPIGERIFKLVHGLVMEGAPCSLFSETGLLDLEEKIKADADLRNYVDKMAGLITTVVENDNSRRLTEELQQNILASTISDIENKSEDVTASFAGRFIEDSRYKELQEAHYTWIFAMYLIAMTPHYATWADLYTFQGDEIEETVPDNPMRVSQVKPGTKAE